MYRIFLLIVTLVGKLLVNFASDNYLVPVGTKPFPQTKLTPQDAIKIYELSEILIAWDPWAGDTALVSSGCVQQSSCISLVQ